ncbi:cell division protein FtsX [Roseivivax marinus]|uniref:Cell division protein FtsX n=1 Tax=Roseivivax marinus TaxID=1379903 RepID=W4HL78_9RHOB|nr:FtsX-like permease family protein [Roseivivax marinus]ETW13497.1 cell division protein FtsX [Roseivivax marinus]UMA65083.1 FtsX-like permease family protein [Roseivivax marinus]
MTGGVARILRAVRGDAASDRVVPPTGFTVRLTLFTAAAMAFLAVFALALSLAAGRLADRWGDELARGATLRISAPADQMDRQVGAALRVLETTPGVTDVHALSEAEQRELLAPWFGPDLPLDRLPIPQLIAFSETAEGYDPDGLRLRLQAEVPGAVLDDHRRWRRPLVAAATGLRILGWSALALIFGALAAMVTLAANAALAANAQVIAVLRLVGATDDYIAGAFVRRFTLRALCGAAAGAAIGLAAVALMPDTGDAAGVLTGIGFRGWHWLWPLAVPALAALTALLATRAAARRVLGSLA